MPSSPSSSSSSQPEEELYHSAFVLCASNIPRWTAFCLDEERLEEITKDVEEIKRLLVFL